jgi:hypothetical protein
MLATSARCQMSSSTGLCTRYSCFCCVGVGVHVPLLVLSIEGLLLSGAVLAGTSEVEYSEAPSPEQQEEPDAEQQPGQRSSRAGPRQQ